MPVGDAGRGGDRAGAAELCEGGFGSDPFGIVARDDHHLGGGVGPNPKRLTQRRRRIPGDGIEHAVMVGDLYGQREPAYGQDSHGMLDGCRGGGDRTGFEAGAAARSCLQSHRRLMLSSIRCVVIGW